MHSQQLLENLDGLRSRGSNQWQARCPAHDDQKASLSIQFTEDGELLAFCHAGCTFQEITEHWNGYREWNRTRLKCKPTVKRGVAKTYPYHSRDGSVLFEKVRYEPKEFAFRKPNPLYGLSGQSGLGVHRYIYNVEHELLCPYNLDLLAAAEPQRKFIFVEGEKAADLLTENGYIATCFPTGAGKTPGMEHIATMLPGRQVIVAMDDDIPGRKHAYDVGAKLVGYGAFVSYLDPFPNEDINTPTHRDLFDALSNPEHNTNFNRFANQFISAQIKAHTFSKRWLATYIECLAKQIPTCVYPDNIKLEMQKLIESQWPA